VKLALAFPDVEVPVKDYLAARFAAIGETVTVGVGVPANWTSTSSPPSTSHIQVDSDGVPTVINNLLAHATVRVVAWAKSTSEAKRLASRAQALLCAHPGDGSINAASPLTGVLPVRDPATGHEIAATTSRVTIRSAPIEP
jgi:hypothetical protein